MPRVCSHSFPPRSWQAKSTALLENQLLRGQRKNRIKTFSSPDLPLLPADAVHLLLPGLGMLNLLLGVIPAGMVCTSTIVQCRVCHQMSVS